MITVDMEWILENAGVPLNIIPEITYQTERFPDIRREEMDELFQLHWKEIALDQEKIKLSVDYDSYAALDAMGKLHIATVRIGGKLIGYHCAIVNSHLHYKDDLFACSDVYFLLKEYRKGRTGIKLFQFSEKSLKSMGVKKIVMNTKLYLDQSRLFEHLGYRETERIWTKFIGD
jgi:hypothetical protein